MWGQDIETEVEWKKKNWHIINRLLKSCKGTSVFNLILDLNASCLTPVELINPLIGNGTVIPLFAASCKKTEFSLKLMLSWPSHEQKVMA